MHDDDMPGRFPAIPVADDDMPPMHVAIVVPPDSAADIRVVGWDDPGEAGPVLFAALGAVELWPSELIPTDDGSSMRMVVDPAAVRSDLAANLRALSIGNHLGMRWAGVVGPVAFVGPSQDAHSGLRPRQYAWLMHALTEITDAYRAAHNLDRPAPPRPAPPTI